MRWGVDNLTVHRDDSVALDGVSFDVGPGETVAVIGGDGAGKSTLLAALAGERLDATGIVRSPGARHVGFVPAGGGFYADLTVAENLEFFAACFGLDNWAPRAEHLLENARLSTFRHRLAGHLSGGQQRKLAGSLAMLHAPQLLILDEVTTGVDPVSRMDLWRIVAGAAAAGSAVVLATTYVDEAERAGDCVLLDSGRVLAKGTPEHLVTSVPGAVVAVDHPIEPARAWRHGRRWREWRPDGASEPQEKIGLDDAAIVAEMSAAGVGATTPSVPGPRPPGRPDRTRAEGGPLLSAHHLTRRFGAFTAVEDLDLDVLPGEIVGLLGANGAGKTTFITMALGLLEPSDGHVDLFGGPFDDDARRRVGYLPQNLGLYEDLTIEENLAFRSAVFGVATPAAAPGPVASATQPVGSLPLGTQRLAAFVAAELHGPQLLVLDEPTSGVSSLARSRLWDAVHELADAGTGVLVSTHYMDEASQADRIVVLAHGRAVVTGTVDEVIGRTSVVEVRASDWAAAFRSLDAPSRLVRLAGRTIRMIGTSPDEVRGHLRHAGIDAEVELVPASLDEVMVLVDADGTANPGYRPERPA